ncbi:unnamed protein product [Larinioides sclopetarius]|uniref:Regulatory protein zeste n=1 Tax=Larinioides sclopetarius TaxID=280406 RepID=A0AAV1Z1B2_9ARAC
MTMAKFEARKNFTGFEREVLIGEIEKYKSAVENKSTKANANNGKTATWMEITRRLNSTPGVHYRRMAQLQGYYQNLKRRESHEEKSRKKN